MTSSSLQELESTTSSRRPKAAAIDLEDHWRCPGRVSSRGSHESAGVSVSRWTHQDSTPVHVSHEGSGSHHCIGINLRGTSLTFTHAGRQLVHGKVASGAFQVTAPGVPVTASFHTAADVVHLSVAQGVLQECFEDLFQRPAAHDVVLGSPELIFDPTLERLAQALAVAQTHDPGLGKVFVDSVSLAIISRLVCKQYVRHARPSGEVSPLPQWRMSRLVEYIDAHLSDSISLADMARCTGLTRMHFAAQFRAATGLRPHEYLLRCRIEHARNLLQASRSTVLVVALSCGFRSQAHFSTVFKRLVGNSPVTWRSMMTPAGHGLASR